MTTGEIWEISKKNWISVSGGVLSLLLGIGIYFLGDEIPSAEAELAQKISESERLAQNLRNAVQLKEQMETVSAASKLIDAGIIRASQVGTNTQYFYKLENDTGVKLIDFRPQGVAAAAKGAKTTYAPVSFNVSVQGTLPQVLDFVRMLESGARYSRIVSASISGSPSDRKGPLTLTMVVELLGVP